MDPLILALALAGGFAATLLVFLLLGYGIACRLQQLCRLPAAYRFPLIWIANGLVGYAVFFAHVHSRWMGEWVAWILLLAQLGLTGYALWRWRQKRALLWVGGSGLVVLGMGIFYLWTLLGVAGPDRMIEIPAARFLSHKLPGDNVIPYTVGHYILDESWGEVLFDHDNLEGWQVSDRPPLQTGFYLAERPLIRLLGVPSSVGYQLLGMILQLVWIPAFWLLARCFIRGPGSGRLLFLVAGSGLVVANMGYVWPKLLSAGYVLLAITILLRRSAHPGRLVLASVSFALALLSHGGALFTAPAFGLAFLRGWHRRFFIGMGLGLGTAVVMLGPWMSFQKLVQPPGNNLVKWHLAGDHEPDDSSLGDAMREAYGAVTWQYALEQRWANLRMLAGFHHEHTPEFSSFNAWHDSMRRMQWFLIVPSAGALWLGLLGYGWRREAKSRSARGSPPLGAWHLLLWSLLSWLFWVALVFEGGEAFVHHGGYATLLLFYLWLGIGVLRGPGWLFWIALALQMLIFFLFWWWPGNTILLAEGGRPVWSVLILAALAYGGLAWFFCRENGSLRRAMNPAISS